MAPGFHRLPSRRHSSQPAQSRRVKFPLFPNTHTPRAARPAARTFVSRPHTRSPASGPAHREATARRMRPPSRGPMGSRLNTPSARLTPRQQIGIRAAKMPAPRRSPYGQQNAGGGARQRHQALLSIGKHPLPPGLDHRAHPPSAESCPPGRPGPAPLPRAPAHALPPPPPPRTEAEGTPPTAAPPRISQNPPVL